MASVYEQTVHTGHSIKITYKGQSIGRIQGIDGERSFGTQGEYEIGSIMPVEHVPLRYEGSISVERFFVRIKDLVKLGIGSLGKDILMKGVIDIVIESKYPVKGEPVEVRTYHGCTMVNCRETFRVNAISGEHATFTYLYATGSGITASQATNLG